MASEPTGPRELPWAERLILGWISMLRALMLEEAAPKKPVEALVSALALIPS